MSVWTPPTKTALIDLASGESISTAMVLAQPAYNWRKWFQHCYDRISGNLTDPSYAGQIVTFTFPHIGNVGTNDEDIKPQTAKPRPQG